jgi:hypothetical protein
MTTSLAPRKHRPLTIEANMSDPRAVATAYIEAVGRHDFDQVAALLHPDVQFESPARNVTGAADYISALRKLAPIVARNEIKTAIAEGNDVCVVYDFVTDTSVGAVPSVEWLTVEDDRIRTVRLIFHSQPWGAVIDELRRRVAAAACPVAGPHKH